MQIFRNARKKNLILVVLLIHPEFATLHCSHRINEAVQRCVQPITQYAKILNQENLTLQINYLKDGQNSSAAQNSFGQAIALPKIGRIVFRELCRLVRNFNECVYKLRQQCPEHITVSLIDASYGFLCNEGYETFMASAECLVELDRQPTVKQCHETTLKHIEAANDQLNAETLNRFDKMCQALNYFASCVERPIAYGCGAEAWTMIFRVLRDTTNTLLPRCQFTGHSILTATFPPSLSEAFPLSTTIIPKNIGNDLLRYREMLNEKAEIIWSNEEITASSVQSETNNHKGHKFAEKLPSEYEDDPRRSTLNSQGEEPRSESNGHVFIGRDIDISYYDNDSDNPTETASSSSFLAVNSANASQPIIIMFMQFASLCWLIFIFS
uniref:CPG4 domain-containing protein n=1 Tax=Elaeophora elaphi TaxID=1147741 RepID=A0A0R3S2R2_9BILA